LVGRSFRGLFELVFPLPFFLESKRKKRKEKKDEESEKEKERELGEK